MWRKILNLLYLVVMWIHLQGKIYVSFLQSYFEYNFFFQFLDYVSKKYLKPGSFTLLERRYR